MNEKVLVIGGGSWGTALAHELVSKGKTTDLYVRSADQFNDIILSCENRKYLPGVKLNGINVINEFKNIGEYDYILMSVPSSSFRQSFMSISPFLKKSQIIINSAKGIEMGTLQRMSEIAYSINKNIKFVCLSGPSHAEEVGIDLPTAIVSASEDSDSAKKVQNLFFKENFRVYTNDDLVGVELAGALKNIIALAAGMSDGLGYGDNIKSALMVRGITEISRLGVKLGAKFNTFFGLAGIGDLIVTCTSMHSRNRRAGILLGKGLSLEETESQVGMVVEGVKTTKAVHFLAKKMAVEMPITEHLYNVLYESYPAKDAVIDLMTREMKDEYSPMEIMR